MRRPSPRPSILPASPFEVDVGAVLGANYSYPKGSPEKIGTLLHANGN